MAHINLGNVRARYELLSVLDYNLKRRVVETIRRKAAPPVTIDALSGIYLEVPDGSRLGLVGANGAGKSTLLRIRATLLRSHDGEVRVFGEALPRRAFAIRGRLGLLGHDPLLYRDLSGRENLTYHARLHGVSPARV